MNDDHIRDVKEQLNRIERCLIGDRQMGQTGLVHEVKAHERRIQLLERLAIYGTGAAGMIGILWTIWSQWPRA